MKRIAAWIGAAAGAAVSYRWLRRTGETAPESGPAPDARAEELRSKLAESRATAEPPTVTPVEPAEEETLEERRRRVHDEARAALDEMQGDGPDAAS